jgi:CAAX protease family protein
MIPPPESYPQATTNNQQPFWDYTDFFLFVFLVFSSLAISLLAGLALTKLSVPIRLLVPQILWYTLAFAALKALLEFRYQQPFWRSLGWRPLSFAAAAGAFLAGPLLALGLSLLGAALHAPEIDLPFQPMLGSTATTILLGIVVVILGPVCEELAFRGFLMPLLIRSLGAAGGIVVTGIIFGSIHGYEYEWSWQFMLLVSLAGCVFGWARYKTRSTIAGALMHSTFNLVQFAAFLWKTRPV